MPSTTSDKKPEPDYRHHPRLPLSTTGLAGRLRAIVALTLFRICGDRRRLLLKQTWSALYSMPRVEVEADPDAR